MNGWSIFHLLGGLVLLVVGAEWLVRGAARLAAAFGIPPLVIGLTVVAFGTSSPELAVSLLSALSGQADVALGNVVGSNIANVLLILGASSLVLPLAVHASLVRIDVPLMIGASGLVVLLGFDGHLGRGDGGLLVFGVIAYVVLQVRLGQKEPADVREEFEREYGAVEGGPRRWVHWTLVLGGLVLLVLGSRWMVAGAVATARALGVSDLVIGLTVVAVATSLPELATSVVAAAKGERDIAVGNVVGSNLFNLLAVLGTTALVAPDGVAVSEAARRFDLPIMLAVAVVCLPVVASGLVVARWEGGLFLFYYVCYLSYLALDATKHEILPLFRAALLSVALPLTLVIIGATSWRALTAWRRTDGRGPGR